MTEQAFLAAWSSENRVIPWDVALVHARHESGLDENAYNPEVEYRRRHSLPLMGELDTDAYGLFQIQERNLSVDPRCWSVEDQMREYDRFFSRIFDPMDEEGSFSRYNGSGAAARRYGAALAAELASFRGVNNGGLGGIALVAGVAAAVYLVG